MGQKVQESHQNNICILVNFEVCKFVRILHVCSPFVFLVVTGGTRVRVETPGSKHKAFKLGLSIRDGYPSPFCIPLVEKPVPSISASHSKGRRVVRDLHRSKTPPLREQSSTS